MAKQAQGMATAVLLAALKEWTEARGALRDQVPGVPQLPLEMALLRSAGRCDGSARRPLPRHGPPRVDRACAGASSAEPKPRRDPCRSAQQPQLRLRPRRNLSSNAAASARHRAVRGNRPRRQAQAEGEDLQQRVNANWDRFLAVVEAAGGIQIAGGAVRM